MKVLFLGHADNIHTVKWVNGLSQKGHTVHLAYEPDHTPGIHKLSSGIFLHKLKYKKKIGYYLNVQCLKKIIKEVNPDVINIHRASGYATTSRLARAYPLLLSVWGSDVYDFPRRSLFHKKIVLKNLLYATMIASTSNIMASQVNDLLGKYRKNIKITPFGVNTSLFKYSNANINSCPENNSKRIVIGIVKTLAPKYGISYLIKAFSVLLKEIGDEWDIVLNIVGDGEERNKLEKLSQELGIRERVHFKGSVPNTQVPSELEQMHIFALSSVMDSESFGVAAVEAMACGLPVIATDVDGFCEVIEDGISGIIVPRKDINAMAVQLKMLIENKELRISMGRLARDRVQELYNWNDNLDYMITLYNEIKNNI